MTLSSLAPDRAAARPSLWLAATVCAWTVVVLARGLQGSLYPRVHWLVSAGAATLVAPFLPRVRLAPFGPGVVPAALFVAAVLLASAGSPSPWYGLAEAGKLGIILILALAVFVTHSRYAHYASRGFAFSAYANAGLLLAGMLGMAGLAREMARERWGTLLAYPGALWRVGILSVFPAAYLLLARVRPLRHLALLAASLALIYFDGSRTGFLLVCFFAAPFVLAARVADARSPGSRFAAAAGGLALVFALAAGWNWATRPSARDAAGAAGRIARLAAGLKYQGVPGLAAEDPIRARMLAAGVAALREARLVGSGIETTRVGTEAGPMVVHMTYLQVLADLGLLGLVAYVWLTLGWLARLPRAWANIRRLPNASQRAPYYNAIFLLFFFALAGLFHPLSTEWSEWVTFLVSYALFWEAVRAAPAPAGMPQPGAVPTGAA